MNALCDVGMVTTATLHRCCTAVVHVHSAVAAVHVHASEMLVVQTLCVSVRACMCQKCMWAILHECYVLCMAGMAGVLIL